MDAPTSVDFYRALGIRQDASAIEINQAYKRCLLRYHPDKNGNSQALRGKLEQAILARNRLSNPYARQTYDINYGKIDVEWTAYEHYLRSVNPQATSDDDTRAPNTFHKSENPQSEPLPEPSRTNHLFQSQRERLAEERSNTAIKRAQEDQARAAEKRLKEAITREAEEKRQEQQHNAKQRQLDERRASQGHKAKLAGVKKPARQARPSGRSKVPRGSASTPISGPPVEKLRSETREEWDLDHEERTDPTLSKEEMREIGKWRASTKKVGSIWTLQNRNSNRRRCFSCGRLNLTNYVIPSAWGGQAMIICPACEAKACELCYNIVTDGDDHREACVRRTEPRN